MGHQPPTRAAKSTMSLCLFLSLLLVCSYTIDSFSFPVTLSSALLQDLERVVVRQPRISEAEQAERNVHHRTFDHAINDTDGCERGILMLERWRQQATIPLQAYEIIASALVENRWRKQWKIGAVRTNTGDQLLQLYDWTKLDEIAPSEVFLEALLAGLSSCSSPDCSYGCLAHEIYDAHPEHQTHHNAFHVIRGYCWQQGNKQDSECATIADQLYESSLRSIEPYDGAARRLLVEAWSKATNGASRCQEIFDTFDEPIPKDVIINTVLAWTKQSGGAAQAEAILLSASEEANVVQLAMQAVISAWAREGKPDRAEALIPYCENTPRCVNSVLHGWLQSEDKDYALNRILAIIKNMKCPNAFTYATLIKAYRQASPGNAREAVDAWKKLVELRAAGDRSIATNAVLLTNIALNVCARAADGERALQLLGDHSKATGTKPDIISYTTVLQALANDPTDISEELIVKLFEKCDAPNARTYAMAILALANHGGSPATAYEILLRGHPHDYTHPYNYVLKCCNNSHDPNSFRIAAKTFKLIQTPDSYSYSSWLRCIQNLIPKDDTANLRERCLKHAAAGAKRHGCWENETVQARFAQCCPKELREKFFY